MTDKEAQREAFDAVQRNPYDRFAILFASQDPLLPEGARLVLNHIGLSAAIPVPTGSRVYGTPREDSDWDWVMPWGKNRFDWASLYADEVKAPEEYYDSRRLIGTLRFGPVNIIVPQAVYWPAWVEGTKALVARKPVTREQAVDEFQARFTAIDKEH